MSKIKLIVEIEKRTYELIKDKPDNIAESIIAHGTPLPEGHGRLVDENPVIAQLVYREHLLADNVTCGEVTKIFDSAVVVEANKKTDDLPSCNSCAHNGEWSSIGNCIKCSCFDRYEERGNQ